jgi:GxxExxY protein
MKVMKEKSEEKLALDDITEKIIGCAYQVSNTLGSGFSESVYEKSLHHQALKIGLEAERQYQMKVLYDGVLVGEFFADLLIEKKILVEIKAVRVLDELHIAQAMNYLKASGMPICLLINFGRPKVEIRRFVPYDVWKENKPRIKANKIG